MRSKIALHIGSKATQIVSKQDQPNFLGQINNTTKQPPKIGGNNPKMSYFVAKLMRNT